MVRYAALLAWLVTSTARAQSGATADDLARSHFDSGRAYFAQARYDDAAREFEEAYRLSHRLPLLLNLARAHEEAGRNEPAIDALDRWLAEAPADDPARVEVTQRRERLVLELEAERNAPRQSDDDVGSGDEAREATHPHRGLGLGLLAGGGGLAAVSVVTGIVAHGIHGDLEAGCTDGRCPASLANDVDKGRRLALTSTVTTFGSVALVGTGLALALLRGDAEASVAVVPTASRSSFTLTVGGRF